MPESQDKKNGKNETSRRDRLISQGVPLLVCAVIIAFVLVNEMRHSFVSHREPVPTKEPPAPTEEPQDEGESKGDSDGDGNGENSGESNSNGNNGSNTVGQIKKGVEAVKNLLTELLQSPGRETSADMIDSAAVREFIEAHLSDNEDSENAPQTPQDVLWGSVVLSNIKCKLADRPDLNINLSVELFYNSRALSGEVSQKQVILGKVAQQTVSGIEFGAVQNTMLRARLLNAFNNVLETGQLWKVDIKNFVIE